MTERASQSSSTCPEVPDATADANDIEKADVAVAKAAAPWRKHPVVKALGTVSEVGDQPQMITICALTLGAGLLRRDGRLLGAGARMLASHLLATVIKMAVKKRVDRTRPFVLDDEGRYEMTVGSRDDKKYNSFPSGHTAGAVAVARAFGRTYPHHAHKANLGAASIAAIQIPRCSHYPSDIAAGALIGIGAEVFVQTAVQVIGGLSARRG